MTFTLNRPAVRAKAASKELSIPALAEAAGIHPVTLYKAISKENPSEPSLRTVMNLASVLDMSVEEIVVQVAS